MVVVAAEPSATLIALNEPSEPYSIRTAAEVPMAKAGILQKEATEQGFGNVFVVVQIDS